MKEREPGHIRFLLVFFKQQYKDQIANETRLKRDAAWWRPTRTAIASLQTVPHPKGLE